MLRNSARAERKKVVYVFIELNLIKENFVPLPEPINSLLGRLQNAETNELSETLQKILDSDHQLDRVAQIIEGRIDDGVYIRHGPLSTLISRTRSSILYNKVRDEMLKSFDSLLVLYRGQYQDPKIEEILCKKLYAIAKDSDPWRVIIVEVMSEVGSEAAIPTLEAIRTELAENNPELATESAEIVELRNKSTKDGFKGKIKEEFDGINEVLKFEPKNKLSKKFGDPLGLPESLKARDDINFAKKLDKAINEIQSRPAPEFDKLTQDFSGGERPTLEQIITTKAREDNTLEYKQTFSYNVKTGTKDPAMRHAVLKEVAGFLNTEGGRLIIGIHDKTKEIIGIECDFYKDDESYARTIVEVIDSALGVNAATITKIEFDEFNKKKICSILCEKSTEPVLCKYKGKSDEAFVRFDSVTKPLEIGEWMNYCKTHFKGA